MTQNANLLPLMYDKETDTYQVYVNEYGYFKKVLTVDPSDLESFMSSINKAMELRETTRQDNIFTRDHEIAFQHAIAQGDLSDNVDDTDYAGNFHYMYSKHIESRLDIDFFKHEDTREYIQIHVEYTKPHSHIIGSKVII